MEKETNKNFIKAHKIDILWFVLNRIQTILFMKLLK